MSTPVALVLPGVEPHPSLARGPVEGAVASRNPLPVLPMRAPAAPCPPVLIIGMHRSGTSVVARALAELGLDLGAHADRLRPWRPQRTQREYNQNKEAALFLQLNRWAFRLAGAAWDRPLPVRDLAAYPEARALVTEHFRFVLRSPRAISFLGLRDYLRYRTPARLDRPWGWKDPRTTFALPLWLDLFPDARVLHVERDARDVAASLQARHRQLLDARTARRLRLRFDGAFRDSAKNMELFDGIRAARLDGALALHEEYVAEARRHVAAAGARGATVAFEALVAAPEAELARMARFCGLAPSADALARVAAHLEKSRSRAHRAGPSRPAPADAT